MDIISVQIAKKAEKKLEAHYSGFDYKVVATNGQTVVTCEKEFDPRGYTLRLYVDGVRAIRGVDYEVTNNKTVTFTKPLFGGEIILFTTDVAGVPVYNVTEEYDDTELKGSLAEVNSTVSELNSNLESINTSLTGEINAIKTALDENEDGSIIDTIGNLKKQWEDADGELNVLINQKVNTNELNELLAGKVDVETVNTLETKIASIEEYIESHKGKVETLEQSITTINESLVTINEAIQRLEEKVNTDESVG